MLFPFILFCCFGEMMGALFLSSTYIVEVHHIPLMTPSLFLFWTIAFVFILFSILSDSSLKSREGMKLYFIRNAFCTEACQKLYKKIRLFASINQAEQCHLWYLAANDLTK